MLVFIHKFYINRLKRIWIYYEIIGDDNLSFYFYFGDVHGLAHQYPIVSINKETKKTINGIKYLNLEFKIDFWVSEESYQRKKTNLK